MNSSQRHDKAHFLQPTVKAISTVLGLPSCIWLLDEATKAFQVAAAAELSEDYVNIVTLPLDKMSIATEVFKTGKTIIVENIASEERWRYKAEALEMGWKSAVVAPLWLKRKIGGILDIYVPEGIIFNFDEKMPIIECFAGQISATLRQVQSLETLNEVAALISVVKEHDSNFFGRVLSAVQEVLDCKHVSIFLADKDGNLNLEASSTPKIKRKRFKPGQGLASYVFRTEKSLLVSDVRQHPQFVPGLSTDVEERSMLLSPIFFQSGCIGVISSNIDELNGFDEYDLRLMETLRSQIAIAIHNVRLFRLKQVQQQQTEVVSSTLNREEVCTLVLDHLRTFIEYDCASIQLIQGDQRTLVAYRGIPTEIFSPELCRKISEDRLVSKIVKQKTPKVISDTSTSELWESMDSTSHVKSWIGVPLIVQDQVIGLLTIDYSKAGYYTEESGEIAANFANRAATALFNADLYQREHKQAQALTKLHNLAQNLLSIEKTQDIRNLLEKIAKIAQEVLEADLIDLYEYQQDQNTYKLPQITVGERLVPPVLKNQKIYKDSSIYKLIHRLEPLYIEDVRSEAIFSFPYKIKRNKNHPKERFVIREKICSTAVIPLRKENESMGLMFINYRTPQDFTKEQRELIELFASQAAIAIKNTRLYDYVNKRREALVKIGQKLTEGIRLSESQVLDLIYEQATCMLGMRNLSIVLYDEPTDTVKFALAVVDGERVKNIEENSGWGPRKGGHGKTEKVIQNREYWWLKTQKEVEEAGFSSTPGHKDSKGRFVSSWIGVPMIANKKVLGVLANYEYGQDNFFNNDDVVILQALADQAAIAIDNARLYARVNDLNQRHKILAEIGQQLTAGIRLQQEKILERIYEQASRLPGMQDNFSIALYDKNTGKIEFKLAYQNGREVDVKEEKGWEPRKIKGVNDKKRGKTDEIIHTQSPLLLSTQEEVKERGFHEVPGFKGYVDGKLADSWLGVPMRIGKKVLGVLATYHYGRENFY